MKTKLSITIDEETVLDIIKTVATGKFRNRSHFIEHAVKNLLEEENSR